MGGRALVEVTVRVLMRYKLEQGTKEGLVASPELWPGANSVQALLDGDERLYGIWHNATAEYFDRKKGK